MVYMVNEANRAYHHALHDEMLRDRKTIFVDLLGWDVPHDGLRERDQFDGPDAEYLIVTDPDDGGHLGSVRLLRTDRPHILGDLFPQLCDVPPPVGRNIREISRMCLSPKRRGPARKVVRSRIATALMEYALLTGITAYVGVADMTWLSRVLSAGWRCRPLGLPKLVGGQQLGALMITIEPDSLELLRAAGRYHPAGLRMEPIELSRAA